MEIELRKIVENEKVNQSLIKHEQFLKSFKKKYDELSNGNKNFVKVDVDYSGNVVLYCEANDPKYDTGGNFRGAKSTNMCTFSLKTRRAGEEPIYFCEEEESITSLLPKENYNSVADQEKFVSATKSLKVYKINGLVAKSCNSVNRMVPLNFTDESTMMLVPSTNLDYSLNNALPSINENSLYNANYSCEVSSTNNGIIVHTSSKRKDGVTNPVYESKESESYLEPSYETLENGIGTLYFSHTNVASYSPNIPSKDETFLDNRFANLEEARTYFNSSYMTHSHKTM